MAYKLVCFDVDGTLVDNIEYSWQLFHTFFKCDEEKRKKAMDDFFKGNITYKQWAEHDINMWVEKKIKKQDFFDALKNSDVKLMKGSLEVIDKLKNHNIKIAIISGSISIILEYLIPNHEQIFDDIFISRITFDKNDLISNIDATEYDMKGKATALQKIAKRENLKLEECVFVGDHHNDVAIAKEAGLSIAFDAKDDELRTISDIVIDKKDLREILQYIL